MMAATAMTTILHHQIEREGGVGEAVVVAVPLRPAVEGVVVRVGTLLLLQL